MPGLDGQCLCFVGLISWTLSEHTNNIILISTMTTVDDRRRGFGSAVTNRVQEMQSQTYSSETSASAQPSNSASAECVLIMADHVKLCSSRMSVMSLLYTLPGQCN